MELRDAVVLAVRHWLFIVGGLLLGLAVAVVVIVTATPQYDARAQVVFAAHDATDGQDLAYAGDYVQNRLHTYRDMTLSQGVLDGVVADLGVEDETSAGELAGRTDIQVNQLSTVVGIVVTHPQPDQAVREADAVAAAMIEAVSALENSNTDDTRSAIQVDARVLSEASASGEPSRPRKPFILLAGLLGGLALGLGAVAVRVALRREPR